MTLQNMIELIQEEYPKYGESYLKIKINTLYKNFCHRTQIIRKAFNLEATDLAWTYDDKTAQLDLRVKLIDKIKKITFVGPNGVRLLQEPCQWQILGNYLQLLYREPLCDSIEQGGITFLVDKNGNHLADQNINYIIFGDTFNLLTLEIVAIPKPLVNLTDDTEISDDFADAIIYGIKENLAFGAKDYPGASYCKGKYKELVLEALKEGIEGKDGTPLEPTMHFQ